jgi:hypothetical protein
MKDRNKIGWTRDFEKNFKNIEWRKPIKAGTKPVKMEESNDKVE